MCGIGIVPGANINYVTGHAIFEATHGTAPKYADLDKVNPGSVILSGEMMLRYMGWGEAADLIVKGMESAVAAKTVTYDFARLMEGAKEIKCSEFGDAIINWMDKTIPAPVAKAVAAKVPAPTVKAATKKVVATLSPKGKKVVAKKACKEGCQEEVSFCLNQKSGPIGSRLLFFCGVSSRKASVCNYHFIFTRRKNEHRCKYYYWYRSAFAYWLSHD